VSLVNTLTSLGLDALEARFVKSRMEELSRRIATWDGYVRAALEAAENVAKGPHAVSELAVVLSDYGIMASSVVSIANAIYRANASRVDSLAAAAPQALGGVVKAGTPVAQSLMISLSGVGLICSLVDAVAAGFQMWSGYCEAADSLESHADRFCAMLRMMREMACGTPAHRSLTGKLPWLLLLEVCECRVPKPDYRVFDHTRRVVRGRRDRGHVYFHVTLGGRTRNTSHTLAKVDPGRWSAVGRAVLLRLLRTDPLELRVQGFDKRGIQSLVRGDPAMGRELPLELSWQEEEGLVLESPDGTTAMKLSYQVIRNPMPTSLRSYDHQARTVRP